ncbi:AraC family transcriptional regulator [Streptomyces sp. NPDC004539]|uniref:helix-turn-helix domain-containing protein n=1 Tax=Streptomyces sp. NPDC004539 TaxID=3154280 RepID=UPI00339FDE54
MNSDAQGRTDGPDLPFRAFLDVPNEVTAPDFGLFRDTLNRHFYPARIDAHDRRATPRRPRISAVHLALTTIGYVQPGITASVVPGELPAYHVNVVLTGRVVSRSGDQEAVASPGVATVFGPGRHTALPRWDADAVQLSIKLSRTRVEEELSALLGRPVVRPIDFHLAFPVGDGPGRRWTAVLSALLQTVHLPADPVYGHHQELLERSLVTGLLLSQPHSYTEQLLAGTPPPVHHGALDRVVEEIERAPDRGYTVADLARLAGTSARSLQYAFRERYQVTPMQFVRQVRLDRAHDDLAQGAGTVADTAAYWGFTNPSRFARAYRDRFGEFPAATLAAARSRGRR